ncbi:MAG: glutamate-5-semialdehyde dehydrogenase [Alphaproteobacteria bacterium]|nr:glutamate-5-semialdehyde dehydrogenase [Alphaproteobacteria bacterium]
MSLAAQMETIGHAAREAARQLAHTASGDKTAALEAAASAIRNHADLILAANAQDMEAAGDLSPALRDRLWLNVARVEAMARGIERIAALPDPVGRVLAAWDVAENGLHFEKVSVPLGVIGIIYEARPNVTADAVALAFKAGNAVILRGGSESYRSNVAILNALHAGLKSAGIPLDVAQLVPTTDREAVAHLLTMHDFIDVIIPRGGKSLTERVRAEARVPTLLHLDGNCHVYVDARADDATARRVVINAKLRRTGVCGALETLLIHKDCLTSLAPLLVSDLLEKGCELRGDAAIGALDARIKPATAEDWTTEYLAPILAIKTVDDVGAAIAHINRYGSHHTDAILTEDAAAAQRFLNEVDSAIVLVNASTQFADGGAFGFGAEIGIATGRLHARGPVGAPELTTYKYQVTTATPFGAVRAD